MSRPIYASIIVQHMGIVLYKFCASAKVGGIHACMGQSRTIAKARLERSDGSSTFRFGFVLVFCGKITFAGGLISNKLLILKKIIIILYYSEFSINWEKYEKL